MNAPHAIFDLGRVQLHHRRAAACLEDFLHREAAGRLCERLKDLKRDFPLALEIGGGVLANMAKGSGKIASLAHTDMVASGERLDSGESRFDLVLSAGGLHWVNDLPGALIQIRRALKPGGLFIGMLPGGQTLKELRASLEYAEMEMKGGLSPRISPFVDVQDGGALLQRAGFSEPVCDSEIITAEYAHPLKLMRDLRAMGETNAMFSSVKHFTPCSLIMLACDYYLREFGHETSRIPASFELVTLTAWK